MLRDKGIKFIFILLNFLCTQCYQIQIIFKEIYLTHRWDPQSGPGSNSNEGVLHTPQSWKLASRCSLISCLGHPMTKTGLVNKKKKDKKKIWFKKSCHLRRSQLKRKWKTEIKYL